MTILNSRVFSGMRSNADSDSMYNDVPTYGEDRRDDVASDNFGAPRRTSTWQDDVYDRPGNGSFAAPSRSSTFASHHSGVDNDYGSTSGRVGPGRPAAPKPNFTANKQANLQKNEAIALFNFDADQPGDLGFKKGDVITILKKTDSDNDWWYEMLFSAIAETLTNNTNCRTGRVGERQGIFPSNYVKMKE
jgi:hypothetical protein